MDGEALLTVRAVPGYDPPVAVFLLPQEHRHSGPSERKDRLSGNENNLSGCAENLVVVFMWVPLLLS